MIERIKSDVAIVGGGIVGASAALALRGMGLSAVVLERDFCGSRSSGINYGGVRRQGRSLAQLPLSQRAHGIWARLREIVGIDGEYVRSGHLKLARSEADFAALQAYAERTRDFDLGLEIISGNALRARYPWIGHNAVGASLCPEDGHANPRLVAPAFARAAARAGADVRERTEVSELGRDGSTFVLRCGDSLEVRASNLINCAGAWAAFIAERFGEPVPLTAGYPSMIVTEPLPVFMDVSTGVEGGGIYARQVARGNCVMGGGQGVGLDAARARPGRAAMASVIEQACELFPALRNAAIIRTWSGVEGYLPDRDPVLGASSTTPGLFHGFGFSGAGFQIGPAAGEVLAELVRDGRSATPIDAFAITRFASPGAAPGLDHATSR